MMALTWAWLCAWSLGHRHTTVHRRTIVPTDPSSEFMTRSCNSLAVSLSLAACKMARRYFQHCSMTDQRCQGMLPDAGSSCVLHTARRLAVMETQLVSTSAPTRSAAEGASEMRVLHKQRQMA